MPPKRIRSSSRDGANEDVQLIATTNDKRFDRLEELLITTSREVFQI
jgi:uncharacterized protein YrzB (UPF0473 family)